VEEHVVLVDEENNVLETAPKLATHSMNTPLHRGFSVFLFNDKGELLLQQRSSKKKTWPLAWSNSVCGHPSLNESVLDAAKRRLSFELGITSSKLKIILPTYRYRFEKDGIVENEICPVMVGTTKAIPLPNPDEVHDIKWVTWIEWMKIITESPSTYSPWAIQESHLLEKVTIFKQYISK
jgi:isopentenyl-diphosphate delta-isomerase